MIYLLWVLIIILAITCFFIWRWGVNYSRAQYLMGEASGFEKAWAEFDKIIAKKIKEAEQEEKS